VTAPLRRSGASSFWSLECPLFTRRVTLFLLAFGDLLPSVYTELICDRAKRLMPSVASSSSLKRRGASDVPRPLFFFLNLPKVAFSLFSSCAVFSQNPKTRFLISSSLPQLNYVALRDVDVCFSARSSAQVRSFFSWKPLGDHPFGVSLLPGVINFLPFPSFLFARCGPFSVDFPALNSRTPMREENT